MARFRSSAIIPFVSSTVAFALLLVLVLAGVSPGQRSEYYLISLNTSRAGDRLIEIKPTDNVANGSLSKNGGGGLLGGIGDLIPGLNSAVGNLTVEVDNELQRLVTELIHEAKESIGLKDRYDIYLQNVCYGNLTNQNDTNSVRITNCPDFGGVAKSIGDVSSKITSYVAIGTTNVSIPFLETFSKTTQGTGTGLLAATTANAAFIYMGLVSAGIVMLLSLVEAALQRNRLLIICNMLFAAIAPISLLVSAVIMTVVAAVLQTVVNGLGSALTVDATLGARAVAITWVAWALTAVAGLYWFLVWFFDARQSAWLRMRRPAEELGDWKKTLVAARQGLKVHDLSDSHNHFTGDR